MMPYRNQVNQKAIIVPAMLLVPRLNCYRLAFSVPFHSNSESAESLQPCVFRKSQHYVHVLDCGTAGSLSEVIEKSGN